MFKNYFYLIRSVNELNYLLKGGKIYEIYSQEKNKLFIKMPSNDFPARHLILSVNPHNPYLLVKNNHQKAKKNVVQFFNDYLQLKLINIEIAVNDRIVKFNLDNCILYFLVSGNNTNVFLEKESEIEIFKNSNINLFEKINNLTFTEELGYSFKEDLIQADYNISDLKKYYPMISAEIKNEFILRQSIKSQINSIDILKDIVNEILHDNIKIGFSNELNKVVFLPNSFKSISIGEDSKIFNNYNEALQYYISSFYRQETKKDIKNELDKYFDKELSTLANKLNKLKDRVKSGSKEKLYFDQGNLLLSNIYNLKKGLAEINLNNFIDGKILNIKLDPKLSPKENIEKYFEKSKDEKLNYNKSLELFNFTKQKYESLSSDFKLYCESNSIDDVKKLYDKLIHKKEKIIKMDSGLKFKYWHYIIEDKYHVYVGRDSKSNDYLSVKFAKQNDYWFHARGLPGSHVVLKVDNVKEGVPKDILKKVASLAGYHSKAKTAGITPISYTFAKYVHKKKGMAPGKVLLQKENTLLLKPQIPKDCVLVDD